VFPVVSPEIPRPRVSLRRETGQRPLPSNGKTAAGQYWAGCVNAPFEWSDDGVRRERHTRIRYGCSYATKLRCGVDGEVRRTYFPYFRPLDGDTNLVNGYPTQERIATKIGVGKNRRDVVNCSVRLRAYTRRAGKTDPSLVRTFGNRRLSLSGRGPFVSPRNVIGYAHVFPPGPANRHENTGQFPSDVPALLFSPSAERSRRNSNNFELN